jgi:hypothetical protein
MFITSSDTSALYQALAAAQADMQGAEKDGTNPHFRASYATLSSILRAILGPFNKHGLALVQAPSVADNSVTVTTRITHKSGQFIESAISGPVGGRKDIQAVGSTTTYLRRYAAQSMCGVALDTDDDGNASCAPPDPPTRRRQATDAVVISGKHLPRMNATELRSAASMHGVTLEQCVHFLVDYDDKAPQNMTAQEQRKFFAWLKDNKEKVKAHVRPSDG